MNPYRLLCQMLTGVMLIIASIAHAEEIQSRLVTFEKGHTAITIADKIKGGQTIDYVLHAKEGQNVKIALKTNHGANYFNVLPPGSNGEAIFIGSSGGTHWTGNLPLDGEYRVRVYLMRSAARRNETASYALTINITGTSQTSALGQASAMDVKVRGTPFHATGLLPCIMGKEMPVQCEFGVIRGAQGNAEVNITRRGGLKRILTFIGDKVTTNPGEKIRTAKYGDDWSVEINDYEHYTIPEAVIFGD